MWSHREQESIVCEADWNARACLPCGDPTLPLPADRSPTSFRKRALPGPRSRRPSGRSPGSQTSSVRSALNHSVQWASPPKEPTSPGAINSPGKAGTRREGSALRGSCCICMISIITVLLRGRCFLFVPFLTCVAFFPCNLFTCPRMFPEDQSVDESTTDFVTPAKRCFCCARNCSSVTYEATVRVASKDALLDARVTLEQCVRSLRKSHQTVPSRGGHLVTKAYVFRGLKMLITGFLQPRWSIACLVHAVLRGANDPGRSVLEPIHKAGVLRRARGSLPHAERVRTCPSAQARALQVPFSTPAQQANTPSCCPTRCALRQNKGREAGQVCRWTVPGFAHAQSLLGAVPPVSPRTEPARRCDARARRIL